jgi:hypothetical protein
MGKMRTACEILAGKPEGKKSVGRPRRRCDDNIKMDLKDIGLEGVDWIHLTQERVRTLEFVFLIRK